MSQVKRVGSLEIDEDIDFARREWRVQRIGWIVMLVVILAALAGAFGNGPLARGEVGREDGPLFVRYERIARHGAAGQLEIQVGRGAASGGEARVWIDRRFLDGVRVEHIEPQPREVAADGERLVYTFALGPGGSPAQIRFDLRPDQQWLRDGTMGLVDGPSVRFSQLVLP